VNITVSGAVNWGRTGKGKGDSSLIAWVTPGEGPRRVCEFLPNAGGLVRPRKKEKKERRRCPHRLDKGRSRASGSLTRGIRRESAGSQNGLLRNPVSRV